MSKPNQPPAAYFHRPGKTQPQDRFQRQDGPAVRARSKAAYKANPTLAKFMGALWAEKHPEKRRESSALYWRRNKHRPEVKERNRIKGKLQRARKRIKRAWESLKIT